MAVYPLNPSASPAMPDFSGKTIPTLWAKKLLERFYDASVLPAVSNTDYEGEIRNMGDKVVINRAPAISINDYRSGDVLTYERPAIETQEMLIDQGHYWAFQLDDVQDHQSMVSLMSPWADDASERLKIRVDTNMLAYLVGKAIADNAGATAGRISNAFDLGTGAAPVAIGNGSGDVSPIDYIVDLGTVLDESNIPESNRKLIIPAWFAGLIKKSDLKDASLAGDGTSIVRNGRIGVIDRFEIYTSNLLPAVGSGTGVFAIHPKALSFATQLTKTETMRSESTFGSLMRGLMVYGRKVTLPEAYAEGVVVKA